MSPILIIYIYIYIYIYIVFIGSDNNPKYFRIFNKAKRTEHWGLASLNNDGCQR